MSITDDIYAEDYANCQFQKLFRTSNVSSKINFCNDTLQVCLNNVVCKGKPLLFFLYVKDDLFSQTFCELLNDQDIEDFIIQNYFILGWNIAADTSISALMNNVVIIEEELAQYINIRKPALFLIIPNRSSVTIEQVITEKIDNEILMSSLKRIHKFITGDYWKNMTSAEFQQRMYEELGDRDYDSFEPNQHHLLQQKIAYAMFGVPTDLPDETNSNLGYTKKQYKEIMGLFKQVLSENNKVSKWNNRVLMRVIYNCMDPVNEEIVSKRKENEDYKLCAVPVFVLRKCKNSDNPCRIYIDSNQRVYYSWNDYLKKNNLPRSKMLVPKNGKYQCEEGSDNVWLEEHLFPNIGKLKSILTAADLGTGVAGILSGAALVAATFTPIAPLVLSSAIATTVTTGVYGVGRSASVIVDRNIHKQSIAFTNAESRAAYLNITAGAVGVIGAGATKILAEFAGRGMNIGRGIQYTVNGINGGNILLSGTATVNSIVDVWQQYTEDGKPPSALTIAQLGASLLFFGHSVYNFRAAGTIIEEVQTTKIKDISNALRSNRHRKMFNKLLKESSRVHGEARGRAEVIATIRRNAGSVNEVMAVLTRSNKNFNKNGIRFAAGDGGIQLNGVPVDILDFGNLPKTHQGVLLEGLPAIPENLGATSMNRTENMIQNMKFNNDKLQAVIGALTTFDLSVIVKETNVFQPEIQEKIIQISENFINQLDIKLIERLKKLLPEDVRSIIIRYVIVFITRHAMNRLDMFEKRLLIEYKQTVLDDFGFKSSTVKIAIFIKRVIDKLLKGQPMMEILTNEFIDWIDSLISDKEAEERRKSDRHEPPVKQKKDCDKCGGYYYTVS